MLALFDLFIPHLINYDGEQNITFIFKESGKDLSANSLYTYLANH